MSSFRFRPASFLLCALACGAPEAADTDGVTTTRDSTADTVHVRVAGDVPADRVHQLTEEMAIAPGAADTTLFSNVAHVEVAGGDRLWVFDGQAQQFFVFDAEGKLVRRVGRKGEGPGEFRSVLAAVPLGDTALAVWDAATARISFIDSAGTFRTFWRAIPGLFTFDGLHAGPGGRLLLKRPVGPPNEEEPIGRMGLAVTHPDGSLSDSSAPPAIRIPAAIYSATKNGSGSSMGASHSAYVHWTWHPAGFFVSGNGATGELILARRNAPPLVVHRMSTPVPVPPEEVEEERSRILYDLRKVDPAWTWTGAPLPTTKAALLGVKVARDGRIWVIVPAPSERIPEAERPVPTDSLRPPVSWRTPTVVEVYEPDGRFVGRVALPRRSRLAEADGDRVWLIGRDDDDMPTVRRMRITPAFD